MIQFGGRFLPVHFVGGARRGRRCRPAGWNLNYKGGHRQRPRRRSSAAAATPATTTASAPGSRTSSRSPTRCSASSSAASLYGDTVTLADTPRVRRADRLRLRRLAQGRARRSSPRSPACATVRPAPASSTWSRAYYIQAAYRLPQLKRLLEAVLSASSTSASPTADAMFATVPRLDSSTVGVRYDASPFAAIKGEYRTWTRGDDVAAQPRRVFSDVLHVLMADHRSPRRRDSSCRAADARRRGALRVARPSPAYTPGGRHRRGRAPRRAGRQPDARRAAPHPARRPRVLDVRHARDALHPRARSRASATSPSRTSAR